MTLLQILAVTMRWFSVNISRVIVLGLLCPVLSYVRCNLPSSSLPLVHNLIPFTSESSLKEAQTVLIHNLPTGSPYQSSEVIDLVAFCLSVIKSIRYIQQSF